MARGRRQAPIPPTVMALARPKTTMSSRLLAPSLLAPCTDADAASPHASSPGTTLSGSPCTAQRQNIKFAYWHVCLFAEAWVS